MLGQVCAKPCTRDRSARAQAAWGCLSECCALGCFKQLSGQLAYLWLPQ